MSEIRSSRILAHLSAAALSRLSPHLERVEVTRGTVLDQTGTRIQFLYFVDSGLISLIRRMRDGQAVEIGAIGREGIATPTSIFDSEIAVLDAVVQIPLVAHRIRRDELHRRMMSDAELLNIVQRYVGVAISQIAQTAACNALHSIDERCCRWLLIASESVDTQTFPLTHEFLAMMLGVRRSSVSISAAALQRAGLVRYVHGKVTILDPEGLEAAACECHAVIRDQFKQLFA